MFAFNSCTNQSAAITIPANEQRDYVVNQLVGHDLGLEKGNVIHEVVALHIVEVNEETESIKGKAVCRTLPNLTGSTIKQHFFFEFEIPAHAHADDAAETLKISNLAGVLFFDQFENQ